MSFIRRYVVLLVGAILAFAGIVQIVWTLATLEAASFGWTAYAPLTSIAFDPRLGAAVPGGELVVIGSALVAGWLGSRRTTIATRGLRRFWLLLVGIVLAVAVPIVFPPVQVDASVSTLAAPTGILFIVGSPEWLDARTYGAALVLLAGVGCVAWWIGAQVARRRLRPGFSAV
jgi:hypothetical protein